MPRAEAMRDWPDVIKAWDARAAAGIPDDYLAAAFEKWKALPAAEKYPEQLMKCMNDAKDAHMAAEYPQQTQAAFDTKFQQEWLARESQKSRRYWMNFGFEFILLDSLAWLALWPFLRRSSVFRTLLHLILVPFIFLLPAWLGYSPFMISGVGPAGGIVYPWLLVYTRPMQFDLAWEWHILSRMPRLLDGINQSPAIGWRDRADWKMVTVSVPGPLEAFLAGLALCVLYLFIRMIARQLREARLRLPGFEVLAPTPSNTAAESAPPAPARR
jgi:hypothetical protein